jgi:hypothetical protein
MTADPLASMRDRLSQLGVSLAQHDQAADSAAARKAASAAVSAIDAMLRAIYPLRGRLVREISEADEALRKEGG